MFRTGSNYYPKIFLEEYKCVVKELKMPENITDKIEISSYSDREDFDEEILMKEILMKKILMKKFKYRMCLILFKAF